VTAARAADPAACGVAVRLDGGRLRIRGPAAALTPARRARLRAHPPDVLAARAGWHVCPRHGTDYRPQCGGCGAAVDADGGPTPVAAPVDATRVAARLAADGVA